MKLVRIALKQMKHVKLSILLILISLAFSFTASVCLFSFSDSMFENNYHSLFLPDDDDYYPKKTGFYGFENTGDLPRKTCTKFYYAIKRFCLFWPE